MEQEGTRTRLIEVGWLLVGRLLPDVEAVVLAARARMLERLRRELPQFEWRMPLVRQVREALQPVGLLEEGAEERALRGWDFCLVVTENELPGRSVRTALGMPSRTLATAVLSTAHLEDAVLDGAQAGAREGLVRRVEVLALHLFGHLNGLEHFDWPGSVMGALTCPKDLESPVGYTPEELEALAEALGGVADLRMEEQEGMAQLPPLRFYLAVAWHSRCELRRNVRQLKPWLFPLRLSRLTIAGVSTLLVMLLTAEAWELGMSQRLPHVALFALVTLVASSLYVMRKQRLWRQRVRARGLTELAALADLSMLATVTLGLLTTYVLFASAALLFGGLFFPAALQEAWTGSVGAPRDVARHLAFAGFVATLALLIGALGATFEEEGYFRHIAYVDAET